MVLGSPLSLDVTLRFSPVCCRSPPEPFAFPSTLWNLGELRQQSFQPILPLPWQQCRHQSSSLSSQLSLALSPVISVPAVCPSSGMCDLGPGSCCGAGGKSRKGGKLRMGLSQSAWSREDLGSTPCSSKLHLPPTSGHICHISFLLRSFHASCQ